MASKMAASTFQDGVQDGRQNIKIAITPLLYIVQL